MTAWCPLPLFLTLSVCYCSTLVDTFPLGTPVKIINSQGESSPIMDTVPSLLSVLEMTTEISSVKLTSFLPVPSPIGTRSTSLSSLSSSSNFFLSATSLPLPSSVSTDVVLSSTIITTESAISTSSPTLVSATAAAPSSETVWIAPPQFTSLDAFNISAFGSGQHNLQVIKGIPSEASASIVPPIPVPSSALSPGPTWDNSSSVIQVFYPANSVDPTNSPQGGADFYASPLQRLHTATNVSFGYSVFFPANFDWVRGGKLPGLYGGHNRCSGGDDALTCFSTRLMWRTAGAGELYLYAPKTRQTDSLCSDPLSVCDEAYGLSVGRGSFYFTPGAWTHVKQTVSLNTPGQQDGGFRLEVNGQEVINRMDVFYRDVPSTVGDGGDQAGGLIGHLLGNLVRRCKDTGFWHAALKVSFSPPATVVDLDVDQNQWNIGLGPMTVQVADTLAPANDSVPAPVSFTGLFFSTFFGGHEPEYATPTDQFTWFKDFVLTLNA